MSSAPKETSHPPLRRTKSSPKIISIYRSAKGERKLQENYDAALQELTQLPFPVEETTVNTAWGKAYVLVAGPEDGIPLFVWQGTATPAPFMLGLFHSFVPKYRVYVPDVPSQAGSRSDPSYLSPSKNHIGKWAAAVVEGLGFGDGSQPVLHAGISFGGGLIIDLARVAPSLISAAALLVPSSIYPGTESFRYFFSIFQNIGLPLGLYRMVPCSRTKRWVLASLFDEPDVEHFFMTQQELAFRHIFWFHPPAKLAQSKEEFKDYTAPKLVITATKDVFGEGKATAERAKELWGENAEAEVIEAKHVPAQPKMIKVLLRVAEFFESKGFPGKSEDSS